MSQNVRETVNELIEEAMGELMHDVPQDSPEAKYAVRILREKFTPILRRFKNEK